MIVIDSIEKAKAFAEEIYQKGFAEGKKKEEVDDNLLIDFKLAEEYIGKAYKWTWWRDMYYEGKFTAPRQRGPKQGRQGSKLTFTIGEAKAFLEGN